MVTVKDVLIYDALEKNREYKEERKNKKLEEKKKRDIEKGKVLNKEMTQRLINKKKSRIASCTKGCNLVKKVKRGITIGKRKKTGEKDMFQEIRNERDKKCVVCNKYIKEAVAWCFAHLLAKGQRPKFRLNKNNIALVCSPECHCKIDTMTLGHRSTIEQKLNLGCSFNSIIDIVLGK